MKEIVKQYGRFLLAGLLFVLVMTVFLNFKGENGRTGIFKVIGNGLWTGDMDYHSYEDFEQLALEGEKEKPVITSFCKTALRANTECELQSIAAAEDYSGRKILLFVDFIQNEQGEDKISLYDAASEKLQFDKAGIYEMQVHAIDDGNRKTTATIRIPVNKG